MNRPAPKTMRRYFFVALRHAIHVRWPVGALPHGLWPSGDGTRIYVGLENADAVAVIDSLHNKVIATIPIGQAPQGVAYAVPSGEGLDNLQPRGASHSQRSSSCHPRVQRLQHR
jgi:YVTN family beta-propeller protein